MFLKITYNYMQELGFSIVFQIIIVMAAAPASSTTLDKQLNDLITLQK